MGRITSSRTQLKGDPRNGSLLASKFINCMMTDGRKSTAQRVFYDALDEIQKRVKDREPIEVFEQALENVKPHVEVRSKRVGGAAYRGQRPEPRQQLDGWVRAVNPAWVARDERHPGSFLVSSMEHLPNGYRGPPR